MFDAEPIDSQMTQRVFVVILAQIAVRNRAMSNNRSDWNRPALHYRLPICIDGIDTTIRFVCERCYFDIPQMRLA